jgi:Sec-independent protein translocase protein TatA
MSGGQMMVVLIVAIVMVARMIRTRGGGFDFRDARRRFQGGARDFGADHQDEAENRRLREEVRALKDRIAVLERIATDSSTHLDREIEALRDRPSGREHL